MFLAISRQVTDRMKCFFHAVKLTHQTYIIGHVIIITAITYGNVKGGFVVAFREGATDKQALHFNARFRPEFAVVRNAMNDKFE